MLVYKTWQGIKGLWLVFFLQPFYHQHKYDQPDRLCLCLSGKLQRHIAVLVLGKDGKTMVLLPSDPAVTSAVKTTTIFRQRDHCGNDKDPLPPGRVAHAFTHKSSFSRWKSINIMLAAVHFRRHRRSAETSIWFFARHCISTINGTL